MPLKNSGLQIHQDFISGKIKAEEIVSQALKNITVQDSKLGAFLSVFNDRALRKAKELDAKLASKKKLGKLAGIPIAVKKFINPKLPMHYRMDAEDLVLPGENWKGPLTVKVYINSHGRIGQPVTGDLGGSYRSPVFPPETFVSVVIDELA